jgi:hypothetical protein
LLPLKSSSRSFEAAENSKSKKSARNRSRDHQPLSNRSNDAEVQGKTEPKKEGDQVALNLQEKSLDDDLFPYTNISTIGLSYR